MVTLLSLVILWIILQLTRYEALLQNLKQLPVEAFVGWQKEMV